MRRAFRGVLAPIGLANGAGPRPVRARPARGRLTSAIGAVLCTSVDLTGPKTEDGLATLTVARTTPGKYTKEKRAAAKRFAEQGRQMRAELAELEAWFVDHGQNTVGIFIPRQLLIGQN